MGTTSVPIFLSKDGIPFDRPSGASPALLPSTLFGNSPIMQLTTEAELLEQITSLRKDMAKLQEHNNLLSSKVDETQQQLNQQQTQTIPTTQSSRNLKTPSQQKKGKKGAKEKPTPPK